MRNVRRAPFMVAESMSPGVSPCASAKLLSSKISSVRLLSIRRPAVR